MNIVNYLFVPISVIAILDLCFCKYKVARKQKRYKQP